MTNLFTMIAKTQLGLEVALAAELEALGATQIEVLNRAVSFEGDQALLYRANIYLRSALKILCPISTFTIAGEQDLYDAAKEIDWSAHMDVQQTFMLDSLGKGPGFNHPHFIGLRVKDAIVDQFREKTERRPTVDTKFPDLRINVHLAGTRATISLDSSGEQLSKRGYRNNSHIAPLNELLAAGMVLLSGWKPDEPFLDPMCGSGTLAIEAALMATNTPPNLKRDFFAFQNWKDYSKPLLTEIREKAQADIHKAAYPVLASDNSPRSVRLTEKHFMMAGIAAENYTVENISFEDRSPPEHPTTLILNPPYGERMTTSDLDEQYKLIGDTLKGNFAGSKAWIISSDLEAMKNIGLRPSRKIQLMNGALICSFRQYQMYSGSKKAKKGFQG